MKDYSFRLCRAGRRRRGDAGRGRRRVDQDARFAGACGYFVYFPATTWSKLCCYWFQGTVLEGAPYVVSAQRPRGRPVIERCRWGWGQKSEDSPYLRGSGRLGMFNNLKTTISSVPLFYTSHMMIKWYYWKCDTTLKNFFWEKHTHLFFFKSSFSWLLI